MRATLGRTSAEYAAVVAVALTIVLALAVVNGALIDMFDRVVATDRVVAAFSARFTARLWVAGWGVGAAS